MYVDKPPTPAVSSIPSRPSGQRAPTNTVIIMAIPRPLRNNRMVVSFATGAGVRPSMPLSDQWTTSWLHVSQAASRLAESARWLCRASPEYCFVENCFLINSKRSRVAVWCGVATVWCDHQTDSGNIQWRGAIIFGAMVLSTNIGKISPRSLSKRTYRQLSVRFQPNN